MWGRGFQQRGVEQLAMAESGHAAEPGGRPGRRGLAGIGALTLAGVVALAIIVADCASRPASPTESPSPTDAAVSAARPRSSTGWS